LCLSNLCPSHLSLWVIPLSTRPCLTLLDFRLSIYIGMSSMARHRSAKYMSYRKNRSIRALRDGYFDFGQDRDGMDQKTSVLGRDRSDGIFSGWFLDFPGFWGITKYSYLLLILRLSATMLCSFTDLQSHTMNKNIVGICYS
jgi:hypothetical protein